MTEILEKIKNMSIDEFYHLCNRIVREMGFNVRNGVYREDTVVIDAFMPVPGNEIRYVIIFIRKPVLTAKDIEELVDFETLMLRWMIITTGEVAPEAKARIPENMQLTIMDGTELERIVEEFDIIKKERKEGSYLPSVGEIDNLTQWAEEFYNSGNYDKALEYVEQALRIKRTPKLMKIKARILIAKGRIEEALAILKDLLVNNIRDDEAWFIMGAGLEQLGSFEDAEEAYGQCVRFNPRNVSCWLNRGNILFAMEKYDEALLCYENALKVRQNIPNAWNNRGVVLKHKGNYDEAMRSYNAALKYDPSFAQAYLNKAILFYEMRRYEEAENALYEYLKHKESEDAYLLLANIYLKRSMPGKAEEMAKKALKINPASVEAKEILQYIHGEKQRDMGAEVMQGIQSIMAMLKEDDMSEIRNILSEAYTHANRGELDEAKNRLEEAKIALRKYMDEKALRSALMEDIIEIAQESGEPVPGEIERMNINELRTLRNTMIHRIKMKEAERKTKEKLMSSIEKIENQLQTSNILTEHMKQEITRAKQHIDAGEFTEAIETLLKISAELEREQMEDMKNVFVEDTIALLREANMDIPENIYDMEMEDIKSLRKKAIASMKGEHKGGGLKEMVDFLSGAAAGGGAPANIKSEVIEDIKELSAAAEVTEPENLESLSLEELKEIRKELIEKIKERKEVGSKQRVSIPGVAHLLIELNQVEKVSDSDDKYSNNAMGILEFEKGNYEEAAKKFKRALALDPNFKEAEFNLAYTLHMLDKEEESRIHLKNIGMDEEFFIKQKNLNP
ncbi:MAG: tetratricopeptide repeat protein [Euryarchaeota archaeon]|nr:tetratricopeptide repeat protein [Euryarchaeota archaeon]